MEDSEAKFINARSDHHSPPPPALHPELQCLFQLSQFLFTLPQELVYRNACFLFMAQLHSRVFSEWNRVRRFLPSPL